MYHRIPKLYTKPPANKKATLIKGTVPISLKRQNTMAHPIRRYTAISNFFKILQLRAYKRIPPRAETHSIPKQTQPSTPLTPRR